MKKQYIAFNVLMIFINNIYNSAPVSNIIKSLQSLKPIVKKNNKTPDKNKIAPQKKTLPKKSVASQSVKSADLVAKYNSLSEDQQIKIAQHHDQSVADMKTVIQNKVQEINAKTVQSSESNEIKLPDTGVIKTFSKDNSVFHAQNELQKLHQKIFEEPLKAIRSK